MRLLLLSFFSIFFLSSCTTASKHLKEVRSDEGERVTLGKVQREILVGMTTTKVIEALGSPNIVTTDEQRRENWIYDKIATETVYSTSKGGVAALVIGGEENIGGGALPGYSQSSGASSTTQRTLTIIIKFDKNGCVRDFAYHASRF